MTELQQAIMTPIVFFDLFDRPIRHSLLPRLLYGRTCSAAVLDRTLDALERSRLIFQHQDFVGLHGRRGLIQNSRLREQLSDTLWDEAVALIRGLAGVPYVRMIAVVNSLSFHNANANSDIDILVVTEPGRIAIARDYLTAKILLWGRRNTSGPKRGKISADVFLDTEHLGVRDFHLPGQDTYVDYWGMAIAPVIDRGGTYQRFLNANRWIKQTFPGFVPHTTHLLGRLPTSAELRRTWRESIYNTPIGGSIRELLSRWQLKRLRRYQARQNEGAIEVSPHRLRFHIPDRRAEYQAVFEAKWQQIARHSEGVK